jgi:hypothetical protein
MYSTVSNRICLHMRPSSCCDGGCKLFHSLLLIFANFVYHLHHSTIVSFFHWFPCVLNTHCIILTVTMSLTFLDLPGLCTFIVTVSHLLWLYTCGATPTRRFSFHHRGRLHPAQSVSYDTFIVLICKRPFTGPQQRGLLLTNQRPAYNLQSEARI